MHIPRLAEDENRPVFRLFLFALVIYAGLLAAIALTLSEGSTEQLFSESGPFEIASFYLWIGLAGMTLFVLRPLTPAVVAGAYLCLCCAAREADWHKAFTGYSVLKIGFYHRDQYPVAHRLIAAAFVIPMVVSVGIVGAAMIRHGRGVHLRAVPAWLALAATGMGLLVATKLMDRTPNLLEDWWNIVVPETPKSIFKAWEEGIEMLLPIIFGAAVLAFARTRPRKVGEPRPPVA